MLDLDKLDREIDSFIANQTKESYNELFKSLEEEELVKLSGGYTSQFDCPNDVVSNKPNVVEVVEGDCDFSGQNLNMAA